MKPQDGQSDRPLTEHGNHITFHLFGEGQCDITAARRHCYLTFTMRASRQAADHRLHAWQESHDIIMQNHTSCRRGNLVAIFFSEAQNDRATCYPKGEAGAAACLALAEIRGAPLSDAHTSALNHMADHLYLPVFIGILAHMAQLTAATLPIDGAWPILAFWRCCF